MLLLLSAIMAIPVADMPVINPNASQPANCPATSRYEAARRGKPPQARKLSELPDADLYKAVYRKIGGCEAPIVVKFGVAGR
ncbi:MAG TPA: hypothetical protein VKC17_05095 [Sphingomicrobium sp.]|jgi:hypothetical protein|nr:hypothetical protein [Sphingomicrobium sp.]